MHWARFLADAIVVVHAAYVSFVVLGMALILLGLVLRWGWVRNVWFRGLHLAAIGLVVAESLIGVACPLTVWERDLRRAGGGQAYAGDFVGYWAHRLVFVDVPPWVFTAAYVAFGASVLAAFVLAPPRRSRQARPGE